MKARNYLPSAQFSVLVISLILSGGLVYVADLFTQSHSAAQSTAGIVVDTSSAAAQDHSDWESTLNAIQAEEGSSSLPTPPDQNTVDGLLQAAQSSNLTESVGRTLLVNLTNANAQGLGDDAPTQDQLVSQAIGQIDQQTQAKTYIQSDLIVVPDSSDSQKTYGNAVMAVLAKHTDADNIQTLTIIAKAADDNSAAGLSALQPIGAAYGAIATDLLQVPVPQTLAPFQLSLVNNYTQMAATYPDMEGMISDPILGLTGFQQYQSLVTATGQVFINIAQSLNKDGILFNENEPGALWASLVSGQ